MSSTRIEARELEKTFRVFRERSFKAAAMSLLNKRGLSERREVLRGVNFDAAPNERIGLIGKNGAGKSTLFRLISRILKPSGGQLTIRGRVAPLIELTAGLHPDLTGRENLIINAAVLGLARAALRAKYDEIVAFADLGDFMDTPCRYYSSGMRARLGFSIAVHIDAEIVLIDEALAVGDIAFQAKCIERLSEIAEAGATVLFVSHEEDALRQFCTRLIWLEAGRVCADGDVDDVLTRYHQSAID